MSLALRHISLLLLAVAGFSASATEERTFTVINAANGLADNSAEAVICSKGGRIIISTIGNVNFYDGSSYPHVASRPSYRYSLPRFHGADRFVTDRYYHLWLKSGGTLTCCDLLLEQFALNVDSVLRQTGSPLPVLDLFADSEGGLWTLTAEGLYSVEHKRCYGVLPEAGLQDVDVWDGLLLTFYEGGEEVGQDIATGKTVHHTASTGDGRRVSAMLRYKDGYFQLRSGADEAVLRYFDVRKQQWATLMETPFRMNGLAMKGRKLYIASDRGYCIYDIDTHAQNWTHELTLASGQHVPVSCNALTFDRQEGLWIGTTTHGLLYAKPNLSPFKTISTDQPEARPYVELMEKMKTEEVKDVKEVKEVKEIKEIKEGKDVKDVNCRFTDSRGWTWIGTDRGLYLYKDLQGEPKVFTRKSGFYNDVVHSVVEDGSHNMWVATSSGVSFIGLKDGRVDFVNSFDEHDNVPSETYIRGRALLLPQGQIVMQGTDHVLLFTPDSFSVNTLQPNRLYPHLTRLLVNGTTIEPNVPLDGNVVIDRAVSRVDTINVNSDQTTVSLIFSVLNYFRPLQSYFNVRVKGLGKEEWKMYSYYNSDKVDEQGLLHLPLFDLEPGSYTVELQASMYPGHWEGEPSRWTIVVNESWWRAKGIYYAAGLLLLLLAVANLIIYIRNVRMRVRRTHEEGNIISKICLFAERAENMDKASLSPLGEEYSPAEEQHPTAEFCDIMERLLPVVSSSRKEELTMRRLGEVADVDIARLYEVVTANIHKSPRDIIRRRRLRKAADMLATTGKSIEDISDECGFHTPNYFMGNFFHEYKRTPAEYREEHKRTT